jgi:acyl carrier protein
MSPEEKVINILMDSLQLKEKHYSLKRDSPLIGAIPEFDSMAVVSVVTALESEFDIVVEDDELDASIFETVGSVVDFVEGKFKSKKDKIG